MRGAGEVSDDRALVEIDVATALAHTPAGRLERTNDPDRSPAPRMHLAGCATGNVLRLRHDVSDATARAIAALVADEPPLLDPDVDARHLDEYVALLGAEAPIVALEPGMSFHLPHDVACAPPPGVAFVCSGTPEGDRLLAGLAERGMTPALVEVGFVAPGELWPPWCVALVGGEVASIAFAARLGRDGAATGLTTMTAWRGRGLGPAVTAAWASHPELRDRTLSYGTSRTNLGSRRVAAKLGLRLVGATLNLA